VTNAHTKATFVIEITITHKSNKWPTGKTCLYRTLTINDFVWNNVVYSGNWKK